MTRTVKTLGATIGLLLLIAIIFTFKNFYFKREVLPTYFSYTEKELAPLASLNSTQSITDSALKTWDEIMFSLVKENKFGDVLAARVYAYVYTAQRDAAFISYRIKGTYKGNIDIITGKVLCLFFPNACPNLQFKTQGDAYSQTLAKIVLAKVKARMKEDAAQTKMYAEKKGPAYWQGSHPYYGQDAGSWKTWRIASGNQFVAPPPPDPNSNQWQTQLAMSKKALREINREQTQAVVAWAGNPGTITPPGRWLDLANEYMFTQSLPLAEVLRIRSVLAMGIADSAIAVFNSKYTYWAKRPFMRDSTITTVMPTPNHPSYPAGHSTISNAAAMILVHYFPEQKDYWLGQAQEASNSRLWGGIHFQIDANAGLILGEQVAQEVLSNEAKN